MKAAAVPTTQMILIEHIAVVNPRARNRRVFRDIVANISELGLKRPITVSRRSRGTAGEHFNLVCGQGRLEAYKALGQREIPAIVVEASGEDCMVMSLVENCARRQHRAVDLLHDIAGLRKRGYGEAEIARKTGLSTEYVRGVGRLLEQGEHRLLRAVESGQVPVSVAVAIAVSDDAGVQRAMQQAYESNALRGKKLLAAKQLVEARRRKGKGLGAVRTSRGERGSLSSAALLRAYKDDVDKKRLLIRKSEVTRDALTFVAEALKKLFADEYLVALLRAEALDTLPRQLAVRVAGHG